MATQIATLSDGRILYSDGSIGMRGTPVANPTPYVAPTSGGNPYLKTGTTGPHLAQTAQPQMSMASGNIGFSGGTEYPRSQVLGASTGAPTQDYSDRSSDRPIPTPNPGPQQDDGAAARMEAERQARIAANNERLNNILGYVGGARGRGGSALEQALQAISGYRDRSKQANEEAQRQIGEQFSFAEGDNVTNSSRNLGENINTFDDLKAKSTNRLNKMGLSTMLFGLQDLDKALAGQQGNVVQQRQQNAQQNVFNRDQNTNSNRQLLDERFADAEEQERSKRFANDDLMAQLDLTEQGARSQFGSDSNDVANWFSNAQAQQAQMNAMIAQLGLSGLANKQASAFQPTAYTPQFQVSDMVGQAAAGLPSSQTAMAGGNEAGDVYNPTRLADLNKRRGLYA